MKEPLATAPAIVGNGLLAHELRSSIQALARHDCTVLVQGESGTGKELAACQIHEKSARCGGPFVPVDCTTLRDTLLESQLFGHVRGAFTGADRSTIGFFRAADGGTIFLDEIGELDPVNQAKLLRAIQDHAVVPLGQVQPVHINVRVIAATHRDLRAMVAEGRFRQDLYYRLRVACLRIPSLRERIEDIPMLIEHALVELCALYRRPPMVMDDDAMHLLQSHDWPGNVRELLNAIEHAMVFASGGDTIRVQDLPQEIHQGSVGDGQGVERIVPLEQLERDLIRRTLHLTGGNQSRAATLLSIERHRLHRRIVRFGLQDMIR